MGSLTGGTQPGRSNAIAAYKLSKVFGIRQALKDVTFELPQNAFLSVFGPNGAGKTTLLRILATLDRPSSGELSMFGTNVLEKPDELRCTIGFISHTPLVYGDLSALENLVFYGNLYGVENARDKAKELLTLVELDHRAHDAARTFSRGMMQRLSLARALIHDPLIVLLDEPYSGLDPHASAVLDSLINKIRDGRTFIMVSHDLERGHAMCTHALLLEHGMVSEYGPASQVPIERLQTAYGSVVQAG